MATPAAPIDKDRCPSIKLVHFDGQKRRVPSPASFRELLQLTQQLFPPNPSASSLGGLPRIWCLKYLDEEGDLISVGSEAEWQEALRHRSGLQCLKLFVHEQILREVAIPNNAADSDGDVDVADDEGFLMVDLDTKPSPQVIASVAPQATAEVQQQQQQQSHSPPKPAAESPVYARPDRASFPPSTAASSELNSYSRPSVQFQYASSGSAAALGATPFAAGAPRSSFSYAGPEQSTSSAPYTRSLA